MSAPPPLTIDVFPAARAGERCVVSMPCVVGRARRRDAWCLNDAHLSSASTGGSSSSRGRPFQRPRQHQRVAPRTARHVVTPHRTADCPVVEVWTGDELHLGIRRRRPFFASPSTKPPPGEVLAVRPIAEVEAFAATRDRRYAAPSRALSSTPRRTLSADGSRRRPRPRGTARLRPSAPGHARRPRPPRARRTVSRGARPQPQWRPRGAAGVAYADSQGRRGARRAAPLRRRRRGLGPLRGPGGPAEHAVCAPVDRLRRPRTRSRWTTGTRRASSAAPISRCSPSRPPRSRSPRRTPAWWRACDSRNRNSRVRTGS
jgi:hypothetical protein